MIAWGRWEKNHEIHTFRSTTQSNELPIEIIQSRHPFEAILATQSRSVLIALHHTNVMTSSTHYINFLLHFFVLVF